MQALLFEMKPRDGHEDHYFRHAAHLRPILMKHDGLIFIERYKSLARPDVILSHSLWRDEASIARWRTDREHHKSQVAGRFRHFEDYRIRMSHVLQYCETGNPTREWGEDGSYAETAGAADRLLAIVRTGSLPQRRADEIFQSVTQAGSYLSVDRVADEADGRERLESAAAADDTISAVLCRTTRDYGLHDRAEAPQHFEPVEPGR